MFKDIPFLFIDVPNGNEKVDGESYCNTEEVKVIKKLFQEIKVIQKKYKCDSLNDKNFGLISLY